MRRPLLRVEIKLERDIVQCRQRAKQIAALLSFQHPEQTRLATAVSEIARNALQYAGHGSAEFYIETGEHEPVFGLIIRDRGPGIAELDAILDGRYVSKTGMGIGIIGSRRLMDTFSIETKPNEGTSVRLEKRILAGRPIDDRFIGEIGLRLATSQPVDANQEVQVQNHELMRALDEIRTKQDELAASNALYEETNRKLLRSNRELEETNQGVLALYKELDERAAELKRLNELKGQFLSNISHEFRTPLNAVIGLSRLLLDRSDGDLSAEQEKQVNFILKAADELSSMVNDLLDLAKLDAGKTTVYKAEFDVSDLFSALKGMFRPLMLGRQVRLVFEDALSLPSLQTDEGKLSQILRNFISNAIKFTDVGEIRVAARIEDETTIAFSVTDTGVGIAEGDLARIFEEFAQVASHRQSHVKGTGLGLPLSRRLAVLLGGDISVTSELGNGANFTVRVPINYGGNVEVATLPEIARTVDPTRNSVIVLEDNRQTLFSYEQYLRGSGFQILPAKTAAEVRELLQSTIPTAFVFDILLKNGETAWDLIGELKTDARFRDVPILVVTVVDDEPRAIQAGADAFALKPVDGAWLLRHLKAMAKVNPRNKALIIDDDERSRYVLESLLKDTRFECEQASSALEGLRLARESAPHVIFLDYLMPEMNAPQVLRELRADQRTATIPVIVNTSKILNERERAELEPLTVDILSKNGSSSQSPVARLREALSKIHLREA